MIARPGGSPASKGRAVLVGIGRGTGGEGHVDVGIGTGIGARLARPHLQKHGLGVRPAGVVPTLALLVAVPSVLALVNLCAFLPARAAALIRPAVALRSE